MRGSVCASGFPLTFLQSQLQIAKSTQELSDKAWAEQKSAFETTIREMQLRYDELAKQNTILHTQLEEISAQALKIQQRTAMDVDAAGDDAAAATEDGATTVTAAPGDMREVVRFLRREKEILGCQHELSLQENQRLKQQLAHVQASLDQTRANLNEVRLGAC